MSQPDNTATTCTKCGSELQPGAKFCPNCGRTANQAPSLVGRYGTALKGLWAKSGSIKYVRPLAIAAVCIVLLVVFAPRVFPGLASLPGASALAGVNSTAILRGEPYESIVEKMKPAIEKLSEEDGGLLDRWLKAHTVTTRQLNGARNSQGSSGTGTIAGAAIGGVYGAIIGGAADVSAGIKAANWAKSIEEKLANGIPRGTTIGKAIAEQKMVEGDERKREQAKEDLLAKLRADNEASIDAMRQAATLSVSKKTVSRQVGGFFSQKTVQSTETTLNIRNNTGKDIAGVKGTLDIVDQFGNSIGTFNVHCLEIIRAGTMLETPGDFDAKYSRNEDNKKKFLSTEGNQLKDVWSPKMIVFADGSKLEKRSDRDIEDEVMNTITKDGHTLNENLYSDKYPFELQERYKKQYAERMAAMDEMRRAVSVRLLSRKFLEERHSSWYSEVYLVTNFAFQNNTGKDITGVQGNIRFEDLLGKDLLPHDWTHSYPGKEGTMFGGGMYVHGIMVSIEKPIGAGKTGEWSDKRQITTGIALPTKDYQFKVIWEPEMVVFADGSKIVAPPETDYGWRLAMGHSKNPFNE